MDNTGNVVGATRPELESFLDFPGEDRPVRLNFDEMIRDERHRFATFDPST